MAHLLLIEDDAWLADLYRDVLQAGGHQVTVAPDAQAAIGHFDGTQIDLIVLDLLLPGAGGVQLLHELRSYPDTAAIPVIIHSALDPQAQQIDEKSWRAYGVVAYVYKVASRPHDLLRTVNHIVQKEPHEAV
jgi:CheY-like chemotaxis protein